MVKSHPIISCTIPSSQFSLLRALGQDGLSRELLVPLVPCEGTSQRVLLAFRPTHARRVLL